MIDFQSEVEQRAIRSGGISSSAIYRMVARSLKKRNISGSRVLDVGCGGGGLYPFIKPYFGNYAGADVVRYEQFPSTAEFYQINLDTGRMPLPDESVDAAIAVETIEHLENPREFCRKVVRVVRPGGWVVVTTPNQLSLLSLAVLITKKQFAAFQKINYPAHISALLEIDLFRIFAECGLIECEIEYTCSGRIPLTSLHYPLYLSRLWPRILSDNLMIMGQKPIA